MRKSKKIREDVLVQNASPNVSKRGIVHTLFTAVLAIFVISAVALPAQAERKKKEQANKGRSVSTKVGAQLIIAQEALQATPANDREAVTALNKLLSMQKITPYERSLALRMRGRAKYGLNDIRGTLADWEDAIRVGGLNQAEIDSLQPNIGQLWLSEGQYTKGANILEEWIANGGKPNDTIHLMIASAWAQVSNFARALPHAQSAFRMAKPKKKRHFNILNLLYHSLKMYGKQAALLEQQVSIWPDDKQAWRAIASLKARANNSKEAFEIKKIMYLNGMLDTPSELLGLVQYYSYYEVPFRGARILEREMNAGRIPKTQKNLKLLSDIWRQSREYNKAIPVLTKAASVASTGLLYEQLGSALYAEGHFSKAEQAFRKALAKGGLKKPGNIYVLIGNALYEQNKPRQALAEFQKGLRYSYSRQGASGWIVFIKRGFEVKKQKIAFLKAVKLDECKNAENRYNRAGVEIDGVEQISKECLAVLETEKQRLAAIKAAKRAKAKAKAKAKAS